MLAKNRSTLSHLYVDMLSLNDFLLSRLVLLISVPHPDVFFLSPEGTGSAKNPDPILKIRIHEKRIF